jgi:O-antigen/teichoic acid export membrane protein
LKLPNIKYSPSELFNFKDSSRSDKAKKNIIILFVIHVFNFLSIMALVPITIDYLGNVEYGIWLTLASILSWLINLDFGIGNGLRNKLAEALAVNDIKLARSYVSTGYAVFSIGIILAASVYFVFHGLLNWASLLKAPPEYLDLLNTLVLLVIVLFLIQFLLKLLTSIINADQRPALNGALSLIVNSVTLAVVFILSKSADSSLMTFGLISSVVPVIVFIIASLYLFTGHYKKISPSFRFVDFKYSSSLVKLGMQFFVIQISSLIVFTTDNIIISQLFGPEQVVVYNVAYKYFYMVPLVFNVVLAPFWSAFTEAYIKEEFDWIRNSMKKLVIVWGLISVVTVFMIIFSNFVYNIWVGSSIKIPFILSIFTGLFVIIANWNNIFGYFINGVGKVRIQLYYAVFVSILNIPLSVFLAKNVGMGITGVIISTNICLIIASIWSPMQYLKIINKKATGIWAK